MHKQQIDNYCLALTKAAGNIYRQRWPQIQQQDQTHEQTETLCHAVTATAAMCCQLLPLT